MLIFLSSKKSYYVYLKEIGTQMNTDYHDAKHKDLTCGRNALSISNAVFTIVGWALPPFFV